MLSVCLLWLRALSGVHIPRRRDSSIPALLMLIARPRRAPDCAAIWVANRYGVNSVPCPRGIADVDARSSRAQRLPSFAKERPSLVCQAGYFGADESDSQNRESACAESVRDLYPCSQCAPCSRYGVRAKACPYYSVKSPRQRDRGEGRKCP